mgnify:CR=1 FL=1
MFCRNCGSEMADGLNYCPKCGTPIVNKAAMSPSKAAEQKGKKKNKGTLVLGLLSAFLVTILILQNLSIIPLFLSNQTKEKGYSTPEEAAEAFADALSDKNVEKALSCFACDLIAENFDFEDYMNRIAAWQPNTYPASNEIFIENKRAEITASAARQIANLCFSLNADEKYLQGEIIPAAKDSDDPGQSADAIAREIENACDLTDIDSLKIVRMDLAGAENQQSETGRNAAIKNAHTYGADMWSDYYVLYEYNGQTYLGGMTFYQYGDQWYINTLNTVYGNQTSYGYLTKIEEEEYLSLVNQEY